VGVRNPDSITRRVRRTVDQAAEQVASPNVSRAHRQRGLVFRGRRRKGKSAMGPAAVVALGVGPEHRIEMSPTQDQRPIDALGPDGLDHPFRVGVGVGGPNRSWDHLGPLRAEDLVEWSDELGVPIADEEPDCGRVVISVHHEVSGLLGDPDRIGMHSRGTQVNPPAREFDEQQDIERPEPGCLDGEEVARDDPCCLTPEELGPARSAPPRGGTESHRPEQRADRRGRYSDPELGELALYTHTTPAWVLSRDPENEITDLGIDRRPSRPTGLAVLPLLSHEFPVPAE
jgi:hypothetical protein